MFARGKEFNEGANTEAEAVAILEALRYCVHNVYTNIMIQTYSLLMKNVIDGLWGAPWAIAGHIEEINHLKGSCNVRVSHIMREGNKLADDLANYALDTGNFEAESFAQLETQGRRLVYNDKMPCLNPKGGEHRSFFALTLVNFSQGSLLCTSHIMLFKT